SRFTETCMSERVGNDVDAEAACFDLIDREADAIERHRTLRRDVAHQLRRRFDREADRIAFGPPIDEPRYAIDVARDEMPAELVAEAQRALEIDRRSLLPLAQCRARQCLGRGLHRE